MKREEVMRGMLVLGVVAVVVLVAIILVAKRIFFKLFPLGGKGGEPEMPLSPQPEEDPGLHFHRLFHGDQDEPEFPPPRRSTNPPPPSSPPPSSQPPPQKKKPNIWGLFVVILIITTIIFIYNRYPNVIAEFVPFLGIFMAVAVVATALAVFLAITLPILKRECADIGWFWVRVPEMSALVIFKDRSLHKILIAATGSRREEFVKLARKRNTEMGREVFIVIPHGKELHWVGCPWLGYQVYTWYEKSGDEDRAEVDPRHSLNLTRRTIDLDMPKVDSGDPISITAKVVVILEIADPEKFLFNVKYAMEEMEKSIFEAWRNTITTLLYFFKRGDAMEVNPELSLQASAKLNSRLGLADGESSKPTFADTMANDLGIRIINGVKVIDIDPTDPDIRTAIDKITKAEAAALAEIKQAEGEKKATFLRHKGLADGQQARAYQLRVSGGMIVSSERDEAIAGKVKELTIFGSSDQTNLLGLGRVLGEGLEKAKKSPKKGDEE